MGVFSLFVCVFDAMGLGEIVIYNTWEYYEGVCAFILIHHVGLFDWLAKLIILRFS